MSQQLIDRSPDLKRLRDEGYDVEVRAGFLLIKSVPYVNTKREIARGTLVSTLALAGDVTTTPDTHVVHFIGEQPCRIDGSEINTIAHAKGRNPLDRDLTVDRAFSNKPNDGYKDYYHKMTRYIAIISGPAQSLDPTATAQVFPVVTSAEEETVFQYVDTASSRAEIMVATRKLEGRRIAIIGLGGTGSYVLDLVAKTPVQEIHLFDGDTFSQHNAFRSPGATSIEELRTRPRKVMYFSALYSHMRRNIVPHDCFIDSSTVEQLRGMDFVFLCLDRGNTKKLIVEALEARGTPFIDVGMGVSLVDESLLGVLRVTTSTDAQRQHVYTKGRIPFFDGDGDDDYASNIQVADLNALTAALAVIKWKKLCGFYKDYENEHYVTYTIDTNMLLNDDQP